jgi:hypothetical protein
MAFDLASAKPVAQPPMGAPGTTQTDIAEGTTTDYSVTPRNPELKGIGKDATKRGFDLSSAKPVPQPQVAPPKPNVSDWTPTEANLKSPTGVKPPMTLPHYDPVSMLRKVPDSIYEGAEKALQGLGPAEYAAMEVPGMLAKPVGYAAGKIKDASSRVARPMTELYADIMGSKVPVAREAAGALAKSTLQHSAEAESKRVGALTQLRTGLDKKLEAFSAPNAKNTLDIQGDTLREAFHGSMESAKGARSQKANELFANTLEAASKREAAGERVDVSGVENSLNKMIDLADGIPKLKGELSGMLSSVKGSPAAEAEASKIILPPGVPRPPVPTAPKGKTFEQLELTRRYLNDIAYSSDMEGYSAIIRGEARTAAKAVDEAMQKFVPEFKTYKDTYRTMSEPLESLGTRFGKAISSTEGGMTESAYSKVAGADLPGRLFAKKDGVELMIDALAGGKNAPAEARAAAAKQVDKMVENWIVESTRTKGPSGAVKQLAAPSMQGTLSAAPGASARLSQRFGEAAKQEATSESLGKTISGLGDRGSKMRTDIQMADELAAQPGAASQQKAYDAYVNALKTGRRAGIVPKQQYEAALSLIDRAATVTEKSAIAKRLLGRIAIVGGLAATGHEVGKYIL